VGGEDEMSLEFEGGGVSGVGGTWVIFPSAEGEEWEN
jgi:hypothetical protein